MFTVGENLVEFILFFSKRMQGDTKPTEITSDNICCYCRK